jgi:hypothetical protein
VARRGLFEVSQFFLEGGRVGNLRLGGGDCVEGGFVFFFFFFCFFLCLIFFFFLYYFFFFFIFFFFFFKICVLICLFSYSSIILRVAKIRCARA